MKRINLELNEESYAKVKKIALLENKSVSFIIREAIASFKKSEIEPELKNDPFFDLCKKIQLSGPNDLSENHDEYLYDTGKENSKNKSKE